VVLDVHQGVDRRPMLAENGEAETRDEAMARFRERFDWYFP
jgi:hypothetical protein